MRLYQHTTYVRPGPGASRPNSRIQSRLVTCLRSGWLHTSRPGTQTPSRSSHRRLIPASTFRKTIRSRPPGSNPTPNHALSRQWAFGRSGRGVHSPHWPQGLPRWNTSALGTLELGDGVRPSPSSGAPTPEAERRRELTAGHACPGAEPAAVSSGWRASGEASQAGMRNTLETSSSSELWQPSLKSLYPRCADGETGLWRGDLAVRN